MKRKDRIGKGGSNSIEDNQEDMITSNDDGNYIIDTGMEAAHEYGKYFKDSDGSAPQVIIVMGATGSGKSRLAIELASHFSKFEIINADSMQVYKGLDVLTNKVPLSDQKGIPHHLLGTVDPSIEFTSRDFRDLAVPIIDDILSRECIPLIVGGTNYYIQALVSTYLVDDLVEDTRDGLKTDLEGRCTYECLKEIDPIAANRIHPNDHRKINCYLSLYASTGVLPSTLFQGKAAEKWGQPDSFRYNCCFLWMDVSIPVLDEYVDQRVDCMINNGLLNEVYEIYKPNADYTRGLRQAIGVREFDEFFKEYISNMETSTSKQSHVMNGILNQTIINSNSEALRPVVDKPGFGDSKLRCLLDESIEKLKANTRKLVRRQIRRLSRLKTYFGWNLHQINATEAFLSNTENTWYVNVMEPCVAIVSNFLSGGISDVTAKLNGIQIQSHDSRNLWSQYVCEACGNKILRGAHEWQQHKQGRGHRKRILSLKKMTGNPYL